MRGGDGAATNSPQNYKGERRQDKKLDLQSTTKLGGPILDLLLSDLYGWLEDLVTGASDFRGSLSALLTTDSIVCGFSRSLI